jgi:DNA-binding transcriptional ArsR family regulator
MSAPPRPSSPIYAEGKVGAIFEALSHPLRRRLLWELQQAGGSLTAGGIAACLPCSASTTSRHLTVLLRAGVVRVERRGQRHIYRLARERLLHVAGRWIQELSNAPGG